MSADWYARPLTFVKDAEAARAFYLDQLGFKEDWRYAEEERLLIVQVSRNGCELILTEQWPARAGSSVIFVSLDPEEYVPALAEIAGRGVKVREGRWGYALKLVTDPDGNQLWFPEPT